MKEFKNITYTTLNNYQLETIEVKILNELNRRIIKKLEETDDIIEIIKLKRDAKVTTKFFNQFIKEIKEDFNNNGDLLFYLNDRCKSGIRFTDYTIKEVKQLLTQVITCVKNNELKVLVRLAQRIGQYEKITSNDFFNYQRILKENNNDRKNKATIIAYNNYRCNQTKKDKLYQIKSYILNMFSERLEETNHIKFLDALDSMPLFSKEAELIEKEYKVMLENEFIQNKISDLRKDLSEAIDKQDEITFDIIQNKIKKLTIKIEKNKEKATYLRYFLKSLITLEKEAPAPDKGGLTNVKITGKVESKQAKQADC